MAGQLTEYQAMILRSAVNLARDYGIEHAGELKRRLQKRYPNAKDDINAALVFWAEHEKRKPHG